MHHGTISMRKMCLGNICKLSAHRTHWMFALIMHAANGFSRRSQTDGDGSGGSEHAYVDWHTDTRQDLPVAHISDSTAVSANVIVCTAFSSTVPVGSCQQCWYCKQLLIHSRFHNRIKNRISLIWIQSILVMPTFCVVIDVSYPNVCCAACVCESVERHVCCGEMPSK